jgi:hypothetical protein
VSKFPAGVVDTGEQFIAGQKYMESLKFIAGVNDTADKFFGGVIHTGE